MLSIGLVMCADATKEGCKKRMQELELQVNKRNFRPMYGYYEHLENVGVFVGGVVFLYPSDMGGNWLVKDRDTQDFFIF